MARKGGLGKGLDALLPEEHPEHSSAGITYLSVNLIVPNPRQPRYHMNEADLQDLAASIREHGVLQPLIVTQEDNGSPYILIAGERRLRAAQIAGLENVPVLVRQATDQQRLEWALIENVQRADLTPLETAEAYRHLSEEFGLSHEEIAARVGKSRVAVTNTLRLLKLPEAARQALAAGKISEGHARALLGLNHAQAQVAALQSILRMDLTVRQTEELVRKLSGEKPAANHRPVASPEVQALEERLRNHLGTRVVVRHGKKGGSLVIHYYSNDDLDALIDRILGD
ncbi:MAG: ParB/RepB/Spo0J family partition protein [Chloroflexi bacterium]|nr:ParB/RepB/Spo0J family partition protein [Chloroflexota bacterium]